MRSAEEDAEDFGANDVDILRAFLLRAVRSDAVMLRLDVVTVEVGVEGMM